MYLHKCYTVNSMRPEKGITYFEWHQFSVTYFPAAHHPPPPPTTIPHHHTPRTTAALSVRLYVCRSRFLLHCSLTTHNSPPPASLTHSLTHSPTAVRSLSLHSLSLGALFCRRVRSFVRSYVRSFIRSFVGAFLPSFLCLLQRTNGRTTNDQMNTNEGRPHTANIALLSGFVASLLRYLLSPPVRPFAHRNCDVVSLRCFVASLLRCSREQRRCAV